MQGIGRRVIGGELVNKFKETVNIVLYRGGLVDAVEFAKQKLMLIAIKVCMQGLTKFRSLHGFQFCSDRLDPAFVRASELHTGALNPNRRINRGHIKLILSASDPKFKISAIKGGEDHFR